MGTRSTTIFIEKNNPKEGSKKPQLKKICKFYRQYDGYPEGNGMEIATFLADGELVNGFGGNTKQFNGVGCLAAQVIDHLKDGVGNIYMIPVTDGGEEYNYTITGLSPWYNNTKNEPPITIKVTGYDGEIFEGTPKEFIEKFGGK
jgi:hypothetical protein